MIITDFSESVRSTFKGSIIIYILCNHYNTQTCTNKSKNINKNTSFKINFYCLLNCILHYSKKLANVICLKVYAVLCLLCFGPVSTPSFTATVYSHLPSVPALLTSNPEYQWQLPLATVLGSTAVLILLLFPRLHLHFPTSD